VYSFIMESTYPKNRLPIIAALRMFITYPRAFARRGGCRQDGIEARSEALLRLRLSPMITHGPTSPFDEFTPLD